MNFRQVKKKIKTVKNVKKITNAMQMVSAVKMRKAQSAALEGREYRLLLDKILHRIIENTSDINNLNIPWLKKSDGVKDLHILVSSNKGLCGSFHSYLFRHLLDTVKFEKTDFVTIGQKGAQFVTFTKSKVISDFSDQLPFADSVSSVFALIKEKYVSGEYGNVFLTFNKYISTSKSIPNTELLLPVINIEHLEEDTEAAANDIHSDYIIEPSVEELLGPLVEDYLTEKLRSAITDSEAAEHSARMMAMKSATDNAGELVYSLTLLSNKLRQSQITNELLDMIAAKESSEAAS